MLSFFNIFSYQMNDLSSCNATMSDQCLNSKHGLDWQTKATKWEGTVQSSTRSQFLWDEMDFENLVQASINEWDPDFSNLA